MQRKLWHRNVVADLASLNAFAQHLGNLAHVRRCSFHHVADGGAARVPPGRRGAAAYYSFDAAD